MVPNGYFDGFTASIDALIKDAEPVKRFRLHPWMYCVAASLIGIVLLGQVYITHNNNAKLASESYDTYVLSQVSEGSIIDYYLASETE